MTYKEILEQIQKDCEYLIDQNDEQRNSTSDASVKFALDTASAAYLTIHNLIEVYKNNLDNEVNQIKSDVYQDVYSFLHYDYSFRNKTKEEIVHDIEKYCVDKSKELTAKTNGK